MCAIYDDVIETLEDVEPRLAMADKMAIRSAEQKAEKNN